MISCDKSNKGSAKVIRNNGGVLTWEGLCGLVGEEIQVYRIDLIK